MRVSREFYQSTSISDVCFGSFWSASELNVVLLRDRRLEFRILQNQFNPSGDSHSWLTYLSEQKLTVQLDSIKTLQYHHPHLKDFDALLCLSNSGEAFVLYYSVQEHRFLVLKNYSTKLKSPELLSVSVNRMSSKALISGNENLTLLHLEAEIMASYYVKSDQKCEIIAMEWMCDNPINNSSFLVSLMQHTNDSYLKFWNTKDLPKESNVLPEALIQVPIPSTNQWIEDYGLPITFFPIESHHSAFVLICQKGLCILDFKILSQEKLVAPMILKDLPLPYTLREGSEALNSGEYQWSPVQLVFQYFYRSHEITNLRPSFLKQDPASLRQPVKLLMADYLPAKKKTIHGENWQMVEIFLITEDGYLHFVNISYHILPLCTNWKFDCTSTQLDVTLSKSVRLYCLPNRELLLCSKNDDHFFLTPTIFNLPDLKYSVSQILENTGSITDILLRQNQDSETGRVLYASCLQGKSEMTSRLRSCFPVGIGSTVRSLTSGIRTEDLCIVSHFTGLTNFWKICPLGHTSQIPMILVLSFLQETRALALKNHSFIDITSSLGIIEDEASVYCSAFGENMMIQVTLSRVILFSLRHLDEVSSGQRTFHSRYPSLNNLLFQSSEKCNQQEVTQRRWSFAVLNPQFVSMFRMSEKYSPENESLESIWDVQDLYNNQKAPFLTPKSLFESTLWAKKQKKKKIGNITLAVSCQDIIALFLSLECSLVILGVEKGSPIAQTSHPRKKIRASCQLKTLNSLNLSDVNPSCMNLSQHRHGSYICLLGTYTPSLEVFLIQVLGENTKITPLCTIAGNKLLNYENTRLRCSLLDGYDAPKDRLPIPESLALLQCTSTAPSQLFIGFRNGELAEYSIKPNWKKVTLKSVRQIGSLPVNLELATRDLLLVYSNRSYIFKRVRELNGDDMGRMQIKQINLPSNIAKCVIVPLSQNSCCLTSDYYHREISFLSDDRFEQLLFVFSDLLGSFHVAQVSTTTLNIKFPKIIKKLIQLPERDQLLALLEDSALWALDMDSGTARIIYQDPKKDIIKALCLWPRSVYRQACSEPNHEETSDEPLKAKQTANIENKRSTRRRNKMNEEVRGSSYFNTVKGMAAALTCCHSFKLCPSSACSTPRLVQEPNSSYHCNEIYLTLGTSTLKKRQNMDQHVRRGSLKLLKVKMNRKEIENWVVEEMNLRRLPDPVSSVAVLDENKICASISNKIVIYQLTEHTWQKCENWMMIRDPATTLSCYQDVVVTGDNYNGVVVYDLNRNEEDQTEVMGHAFSCPSGAFVVDHVILDENHYAMITKNGQFSICQKPQNTQGCERNLKEISKITFNSELTGLSFFPSTNGITEFFSEEQSNNAENNAFIVASKTGALYLIHDVPDEMKTVFQDEQNSKEDSLKELELLLFDEYSSLPVVNDQTSEAHLHNRTQLLPFSEDLFFHFS